MGLTGGHRKCCGFCLELNPDPSAMLDCVTIGVYDRYGVLLFDKRGKEFLNVFTVFRDLRDG